MLASTAAQRPLPRIESRPPLLRVWRRTDNWCQEQATQVSFARFNFKYEEFLSRTDRQDIPGILVTFAPECGGERALSRHCVSAFR